jgi:hypothetical protein
MGNGSANNNIVFARQSTTNNLCISVYNGSSGTHQYYSSGGISYDSFHVYTATVGNGFYKIYKNGVEIYSIADSFLPVNITRSNNYIGKSNWADALFNGFIPLTQIYNRALTAAEIQQNFNALRGRYGV